MIRDRWTDTEVSILKTAYPEIQNKEISFLMGRTTHSIAHKASALKIKKSDAFNKTLESGRYIIGSERLIKKTTPLRRLIRWIYRRLGI